MKVDSKHIVPFLETIKGLLSDLNDGFPECEDKEQLIQCFDNTYDDIKSVIISFKIDHLTPILKPTERTLPTFVLTADRQLDERKGLVNARTLSDYEERMEFMSKMYFAIKRKLEYDGVDHLLTREKVYHHIFMYLVSNDPAWDYYFNTILADAGYKVIDTIVDEIMEQRRKYPQLQLSLSSDKPNSKSNSLIDIL